MKIAICGAGNEGCALAADLSYKGNEVKLIKTSESIHDSNFNYLQKNLGNITLIESTGEEKKGKIKLVTRELNEISDCEIIIITIQTSYHEELIKKMVKYLNDNQIVLINPGYFSTAYFLKHCSKNICVVEAESSFIDCRIVSNGVVSSFFRNVRNPVGVFPSEKMSFACKKLEKLKFPLTYITVVEAALHNPNLILHTSGAIMNITSIEKEKDEFCLYGTGFTEATLRILEALDNEKIEILEALGLKGISYFEACKYRNSLSDENAKDVFINYTKTAKNIKGPSSIYSRYITEDVSQGLVMLESIGKHLNIHTPVCTALIDISSKALAIDFRKNGRNIDNVGEKIIKKILRDSINE